jgi:hypothetical protein
MMSFSLPGLAGSMIYDTFSTHPTGNWTGPKPGINATVCATTFRSTCEAKTALSVSVSMDEVETVLYEIFFDDGWSTRVDPAAGQIETKNHSGLVAVPMVRVIPAPSVRTFHDICAVRSDQLHSRLRTTHLRRSRLLCHTSHSSPRGMSQTQAERHTIRFILRTSASVRLLITLNIPLSDP